MCLAHADGMFYCKYHSICTSATVDMLSVHILQPGREDLSSDENTDQNPEGTHSDDSLEM